MVLVGWHPTTVPVASTIGALVGWQQRLTNRGENPPTQLQPRVRLLSLDYGKTMGRWWVTGDGRRRWLAYLRTVKDSAPERVLRVHNVPADGRIYTALLSAGVDLIGTKQLTETARLLAAPAPP